MLAIGKSKRVETLLRGRIAQGIYKPGTKLPDPAEISAELGVSDTTVKGVFTQLANDGLLERIQKKGTFVAQRVQAANVVLLHEANTAQAKVSNFYQIFTDRFWRSVDGCGYQPIVRLGCGDNPEKFLASIQFPESFESRGTVGIVSLVGLDSQLAELGLPFVTVLMSRFEGCQNAVILDYARMHELAGEILRARGHTNFALMYGQIPQHEEDSSAMFREMRRQRLALVDGQADRLIPCPFTRDYRLAYDVFKDYWLAGNRPRAIFFSDEVLFDVVSRAVLELGIRVPDELALLTEGIVDAHYHFPIPVSCLEFDAGQVAATTWYWLQQLILGKSMTEPVLIKPRLRDGATL